MKTLYTVLGIDADASTNEINLAFSRAKLRFPEAKLAGDENAKIQFQAIAQAHATLVNDDSRAAYDARLARAGVKVATVVDDEPHGWFGGLSTRNIVVAGVVVALISGMWFYHAREKVRVEKELAAQILKMAEEEQKRRAGEAERAEARRDEDRARSREREAENRAARERSELTRAMQTQGVRSDYAAQQERNAAQQERYAIEQRERQAAAEKSRQEYANQNAARQSQMEAERRLQAEKRQLREACMARYNKPDC